jgi:hypothetical protein
MAVISIKNKTKSGSLLNGNTPYEPGDFESIQTVTVGSGGAASISFTSIPQTFTHLQIRGIANSGDASYIAAQFNGDTATNYSNHAIYGDDGGTLVPQQNASTTNVQIARSNYVANSIFGTGVCDILDYANTNKFKTTRALAGNDSNGTAGGVAFFSSGNWRSTSAITSVSIFPTSGSFRQYSSFALYGIKG